jgi:hypothetical protein
MRTSDHPIIQLPDLPMKLRSCPCWLRKFSGRSQPIFSSVPQSIVVTEGAPGVEASSLGFSPAALIG